MTVHLVLQPPDPALFRQLVAADDHVIDLCWEHASDAHLDGVGDVVIHGTELNTKANFERSRDDFLDWLVEVSEVEFLGKTLVEWLRWDDHLSLWWVLGFSVKSVHFDLWGGSLFLHWLEATVDSDGPLAELFDGDQTYIVWADRNRLAHFVADALGDVGCPIGSIAVQTRQQDPNDRDGVSVARRWLRVGTELAAGELFWAKNRPTSAPPSEPPDIIVPTVASSWHELPDGTLRNRYLADVEHRLAEAGLTLHYVPACAGGRTLESFHRRFSHHPDRFRWDLLEKGPAFGFRVLARLQKLRRRISPLFEELSGHPALSYRRVDTSLWFRDALNAATLDVGFQTVHLYEMMQSALRESGAPLVLYKDEFYSSGRVVSAAIPDGVGGWAFQHGTISTDHLVYVNDRRWVRPGEESDYRHMPTPDYFLCYGEFAKGVVTQRGYPEDRVLPIGSLRHDEVYEEASRVEATPADFDLPTDRPIVTLCAGRPNSSERWLRMLIRGAQRADLDCHIVVKPHPRFDVTRLCERIFDELGWSDHDFVYDRLSELLVASDVMLTGGSTTGLDSILLGTPLITFQYSSGFERFPYAAEGVAIGVSNPESMADALTEVLSEGYRSSWGESRQRFLRRHLSPHDGHAVEAFIELFEREIA